MFERYVTFIVRHRVAVILSVLLVTVALGTQLRHLHFEIKRRAQLPQEHPYVRIQNEIADRFGGETTLVIGVLARQDDVFTAEILARIIRVTRQVEDIPGIVPSSLLSIAARSVKSIRPAADGMDVRPLLDVVPTSDDAIRQLRDDILNDPIYAGILVARDGTAAAIIAEFDERLTDVEIVNAVERIVAPEEDDLTQIVLGGSPFVRVSMLQYTRTMAILFPLAVLVIAIVHYEAFRTWQATVLPLVTALLSVSWSLGIMGALRQPMDTWTAITPVVILAVAAGHAVQILKRYYEELGACGDSEAAVVRSTCAVGPVMLTAGLVAAAGFASLVTFGVTSVRAFGLLLASGILSSLTIEMTFIPACRAKFGRPREAETRRERESPLLSRVLASTTHHVVTYPARIIVISLAVAGLSLLGVSRLKVDNSLRAWFPDGARVRTDDELLNERLAGTSTVSVLLEGGSEGDLEDPIVLSAIDDLQRWLGVQKGVGATLSLVDFVKRMHSAISGKSSAASSLPDSKSLVAQYLFLYSTSGPDDFNHVVDPTHRWGVLRAFAKSDGAEFAKDLFSRLELFASQRFRGLPVRPRVAGGALAVQTALNDVVVRDKVWSVAQVALLIYFLSSLVLWSLTSGLLVLAPLSLALLVTLGIMGFTGTWLSVATATVAAMAVGIGADFAIYLIFRLKEELSRAEGDLEEAVQHSLMTSGKAIFFVSSAVVLGFMILGLSGFRVWLYLGALTSLMVAISAAATLTLIPALVLWLGPRGLFSRIATYDPAHAARDHPFDIAVDSG